MQDKMWKFGDWAGSMLHNTITPPVRFVLPRGWSRRLHDWTHNLWMKWGKYDEF